MEKITGSAVYSSDCKLNANTVLDKRYKIMETVSQNAVYTKYMCLDGREKRNVYIYEYFPTNLAVRNKENNVVRFKTNMNAEIYAKGLNAYVKEVEKLKDINEDSVENVLDCFIENNTCYCVCEYEKYETLDAFLKKSRMPSVRAASKIFRRLSSALIVLHKNGIVLGNISPEHIAVTEEGNIKFIDLGIGCHINSTGMTVFNPKYSPDGAETANVSKSSDVYSMGVLYYRLLAGFTPKSAEERQKGEKLVPLRKLGINVGKNVDNAIQNALCLDPKVRYRSMESFLNAVKDKNTKLAKYKSPGEPGGSGGSEKAVIIGGIAAGILILCLAGAGIYAALNSIFAGSDANAVIYINGSEAQTQVYYSEEDKTAYIPVTIYKDIDLNVAYDDETRHITITSPDGISITNYLGEAQIRVNENLISLGGCKPSCNIDGHNYFDKKVVVESLNNLGSQYSAEEKSGDIYITALGIAEESTSAETTTAAQTTTAAAPTTQTTTQKIEETTQTTTVQQTTKAAVQQTTKAAVQQQNQTYQRSSSASSNNYSYTPSTSAEKTVEVTTASQSNEITAVQESPSEVPTIGENFGGNNSESSGNQEGSGAGNDSSTDGGSQGGESGENKEITTGG